MHYTWIGICTIKRREKVRVVVLHILLLGHLLMPDSAACPGQHVWYVQLDQIPKAAAPLTAKDQGTSIICIGGEDLPIQILTKYVFSTLDFSCSYVV